MALPRAGFAGKRVTVVGLARSGVAVSNLLHSLGASVTVTDLRPASELAAQAENLSPGINRVFGSHPDRLFTGTDLVVVSPGVPADAPPLAAARRAGIEVIGELEVAYMVSDSPFIAITGTNGKSTTTTLVGLMLEGSGLNVFVGGNLGNALTEEPGMLMGKDYIVAEVSSFQLDATKNFRPRISAILNITQDHLDRYAGMGEYTASKARVFMNQGDGDLLLLNADDPPTIALKGGARCGVMSFSTKGRVGFGAYVKDGTLVYAPGDGSENVILPAGEIAIKGAHNLENALAAAAISLAAGASVAATAKVLRDFTGLEHRMEFVREFCGVTYINDSKGTNVGAVEKSLEGFDRPVILIAGGLDKHSDFSILAGAVRKRVKKLILIGKAAGAMEDALGSATETVRAGFSLEDAVRLARESAAPGDVVLLSPACASFDMFRDFEDRGRQFKEMVGKL